MYGRYETLTRQELYELVWSTPVMKLCERFGLSDRGLAKLCDRHEVPVPERGWWAKQAAGHAVQRTALPKAKDPYTEHVQVWVREDWRQYVTTEEQQWVEQRLADEATRPVPFVRAEDDSRHPLIVQARKTPKEDGPVRVRFAIDTTKELRPRALRFATALVEACEARGYEFALRPNDKTGAAGVVILGQSIGMVIEEPFAKVPHVLTKAEAREKAVGRGWSIPEFDSVRSGQLVLVLDHPIGGERRSFGEKAERLLEASFPDVLKSLLRVAIRMRAEDNYRTEQVQRQREVAERREAAERLRREEEARIAAERRWRRALLRQSAALRRKNELLELITSVEAAAAERGTSSTSLAEWLTHARAVVSSLNPVGAILESVSPAGEDHEKSD